VTEIYDILLCAHALQVERLRLNPVSNEGNFTLESKVVFHPYLPSHCRGVTKISHIALRAHALHFVEVRLKSVSNEGHFAFEGETVFRPYLSSN
jgi:hypothetical protein